jgi:hypothetical protein
LRKGIVRIGLVLIVLGIILVVVGIGATADYLTVSTSFIHQNSAYTSTEINLTGQGFIGLEGNSTFYVISASNLSVANSTNIKNYAIAPEALTSSGYGSEFLLTPGSYYLISFLSPQSGVAYSYTSHFSTFTDLGIILLFGLFLIGVSIIFLVVGFLLKTKQKSLEQDILDSEIKS